MELAALTLPPAFDEMVNRIVAKFAPIEIRLFGSRARGDARADSDVDLLVVMPDGTDLRETTIAILRLLRDAPFSKDVVVATPETLKRFGKGSGMVYEQAIEEGKPVRVGG
jgi:predicted nucleotidyltransferase